MCAERIFSLEEKILALRWMFFDVDGIFTDGGLFYGVDGEVLKRFNVLDGYGIKQLMESGISVGLISGRDHPSTKVRARELGITNIMLGVENKLEAFSKWTSISGVDPKACGHMGDDYPDLELFKAVGFSASVPNATDKVKKGADFVTKKNGGMGAVREICELILDFREPRAS